MAATESVVRYRWVILGVAFLSQGTYSLTTQSVAPLAPLFREELGLTKAEVGLFSTAIYYGAWGVLVVAGSLADRFGVRRTMSAGLLISGTVLVCMSMVGTLFQAMVVMFVAGLGRGTVAPAVTKAIMDWFPPRARATAMGVKQTGVPVSGILAAATLPALGLLLGWRWAMALVGFLVMASGIVGAILYRDVRRPASSPTSQLGTRAVLRTVVQNRGLWTVSSIALLFSAAQTTLSTYLALYFADVVLVTAVPDVSARIVAAGGYLALCQVGGIFARVSWGMASDRLFHGRRIVVLAMVGAISGLMTLLLGSLGPDSPLWLLSAVVVAVGASVIGWGGLYLAAVVETAGPKHAGAGVGLSMTVMQCGNVAGAPIFGMIVDASGSYQAGWIFVSVLFGTGAIVAALLARGEKAAT